METTFISIHDLSLDARLLYVSSSIEDILGYKPQEVIGKSCWDYFHPDEIPFARAIHGRGIKMDKAAALNYCQIKNRDGRWVGCECVFTIVHDVLVGCTSVYRRGAKSDKRAREAPVIRRLFSSSPRDPRYHMLSYISHKFSKETRTLTHEPRAALFLNRFSRTLTIMYATNGLADIVGIPAHELNGRSFYYCIQENCLREAVKCLESAKANDSIAYLRFWFRDPRQDDLVDRDEHMSDGHSSGDDDDGGVNLSELMDHDGSENAIASDSSMRSSVERDQSRSRYGYSSDPNSRSSSGNSTDLDGNSNDAIFDRPVGQTRASSVSTVDEQASPGTSQFVPDSSHVELEAVVSCTSDGLVVVLRRARPFIAHFSQTTLETTKHPYANGFFASPWATDPLSSSSGDRPSQQNIPNLLRPSPAVPRYPTAASDEDAATHGPATEDFMNSIREVAVFAWALTGINGSLAQYTRGTPTGESQPPDGLPVWKPPFNAGPEAERRDGYFDNGQNYTNIHGDWQGQKVDSTHGYEHQSQNSAGFGHGTNGFPHGSSNPTQTNGHNQALYTNGQNDLMQMKSSNDFVPANCHIEPMQTNGYNASVKGYDHGYNDAMQTNEHDDAMQSHEQINAAQYDRPWTHQPQHGRVWEQYRN